jgi:hypothetical protein
MAGDWIPYEIGLPNKPQVLLLADAARMKPREVVGLLMEFWGWASMQTHDGNVTRVTLPLLVKLFPGSRLAFWEAMTSPCIGWLEVRDNGVYIPRANKWITRGAKARLKKSERQAMWRSGSDNVDASVDATVGETVDAQASTLPSTTEEKRTEEKRTEEKRKEEKEESKDNTHTARTREVQSTVMDAQNIAKVLDDPDFKAIHAEYPPKRRIAARVAAQAFAGLDPPAVLPDVLAGLQRLKGSGDWTREGRRYVPGMVKWIEARGWEEGSTCGNQQQRKITGW